MDERKLKELAFQIFDVNGDKKVSENDMFELMKITSGVKGGYVNMMLENLVDTKDMTPEQLEKYQNKGILVDDRGEENGQLILMEAQQTFIKGQ